MLASIGLPFPSSAETTLEAKLVPAVVINGPLNSLQQIQYSTNIADTNAWTVLSYVRLDATPKRFHDDSANGEKRYYRTKMVGVSDTNLIWIPPGVFTMGSPTNEEGRTAAEGPQTLVTLTKGFLMGRFEVRNVEWLVYSNSLLVFADTNLSGYLQRPLRGTGTVLFTGATNYCLLRTLDEQQRGLIPPGWFYRLPTEAEWEYACRAGSITPFGIGSGLELRNDAVRQDATFNGNLPYPANVVPVSPIQPADPNPVGGYAPNAFGLYDMHGNVSEITWDFLGATLPGGSVTNPVGPAGDGWGRSGAYNEDGANSRSARRKVLIAGGRAGFRVVLIPANEP